ncbi:MAG: hypothetical protein HQ567_02870 [Candidatus Nealsonbacteria bacterium]|nr:hypothetical protein [Candidatus Nealsonbacteria bacterium]
MRYWILPLALAMLYAGVSESEADSPKVCRGECPIEAELVACDEVWVVLRKPAGDRIDLPLSELSRADQRWVRQHASTSEPRGLPPRFSDASGSRG